jgi:hypothetical protein
LEFLLAVLVQPPEIEAIISRRFGSCTMKITERFEAIDKIGRELQRRFGYREIDKYLAQFGIKPPPDGVGTNSKWVYSKEALADAPLSVISQIADDLDLGSLAQLSAQANPPGIWKNTAGLRVFLSHISKDKVKATRLRDCLKPFGILAFVAHEDIEPTKEWQAEIERGLHCMDAFVSIHTVGFSKSIWTQQEIGVALGRGVKIIALRMGEDPTGFISKHQALSRGSKTAEAVAQELSDLFTADERTANRLADAQAAFRGDDEIPF